MKRYSQFGLVALALAMTVPAVHAQLADFTVAGRSVVMHGFLAEGYMKSDGNNFLTAQTGAGTFQDVEGALNIATNLTDNLHVGAQVYVRDIGRLGGGMPTLDWAYADYKVRDWLGFRGGKVKTPMGLYNDTQDMEFLHPWVLLPQATYASNMRSLVIAHTGGDVYGTIDLRKAGSVTYQAYGGVVSNDPRGGYIYLLQDQGLTDPAYTGKQAGFDVRWKTPAKGLKVGMSYMWSEIKFGGNFPVGGGMYLPLTGDYRPTQYAGYAEYRHKGLTLAGEYWPKTAPSCSQLATMALPCNEYQYEGGYASVAYRFTSWLQLGAYNSRYQFNSSDIPAIGLKAQDNHIDDQAFTARFDFKRHWDLKFEQHFMNGVSSSLGLSGFYASDNPQGLKPNTRLFLIRLGFNI